MKYTKHFLLITCAIFTLLLNSINLFSQNETYTATKTIKAPKIDGIIDDSVWMQAEWEGNFIQQKPFEKKAPSQQTQFKILYNNSSLYIAVRAFDASPDSIEKRLTRRDDFEGDWITLGIDSYHDLLTGFEFSINAAGVKCDEKVSNDDNNDDSWDPVWFGKTNIDNLGWTAEIQIPLTQLRFGKKDEYVWGLQIVRYLFRREEYSMWKFAAPSASGWVHHYGELHGIKDIKPKKQRELTPYVLGKVEFYEGNENNPFSSGQDLSGAIGLDGKFGVTNDLTLDFSINPDFGQVEADPSEVNLSTFETYFTEKRPFFIEGNNILSQGITSTGSYSDDDLFYSRRIGKAPSLTPETDANYTEYVNMPQSTSILGAFKLTGKTKNGLSLGILESVTQKEWAEIARDVSVGEEKEFEYRKEIVEPLTNYFVSRIEKDLNESNTQVGAMVTAVNRKLETDQLRSQLHKSAYSAGFNFKQQWKDKTYYIDINAAVSQINGSKEDITTTQTSSPHYFQRPDASHITLDSNRTSLTGTGGTIEIGKAGNGKWSGINWLTFRSPGFNINDIGYLYRNDEIQQILWIRYQLDEPKSFYRNIKLNFNHWYGTTMGLEYRYHGINANVHTQLKNYWRIGLSISADRKSYSPELLRGGPLLLSDPSVYSYGYIESDTRKKIHSELGYEEFFQRGGSAYYSNYWLDTDWQVYDALKITIEPTLYKRFNEIEYIANKSYQGETRYIRGSLNLIETSLTLRFTYNIGPDFTLQYYGMPFISCGRYTDFKQITDSKAEHFHNRFSEFSNDQISYNSEDNTYYIDEDNDNDSDYSFSNPNFNVKDFNSNLVLRWEYLPGSYLYIVWNQQRYQAETTGEYSFMRNSKDLFLNTYPEDIFLIKLSYRIGT